MARKHLPLTIDSAEVEITGKLSYSSRILSLLF
jgi:hypothetical protein